jgi:S-adenosylmethionine hydrolase
MAAKNMITLTTDFGLKDPYVGEMKGVILSINPKSNIVDITHDVEKFNTRMGAFTLASAATYFPKGTIHLAVVDPRVGTERRAILVQTKEGFFVGPDNGVLMLAAQAQDIEHIYEISNQKFMLPNISNTFHGRDIFAPVAAHLDKGIAPSKFGQEITDATTPNFTSIERKNSILIGEILHVDSFGNLITNIDQKDLSQAKTITVNLHHVSLQLALAKTYAQAKPKEPLALIGSHDFLEVALNQASFAEKYRVRAGDRIEVALA